MADIDIELTATGRKSEASQYSEVIFLGIQTSASDTVLVADDIADTGDWEIVVDVLVGQPLGRLPIGLKGHQGSISFQAQAGSKVALLCHDWSGICSVSDGSTDGFEVDLYSAEPCVVLVDPQTGDVSRVESSIRLTELKTQDELKRFSPRTIRTVTAQPLAADTLRIRPVGEQNPLSKGHEVILMGAEPFGLGINVDFKRLAASSGWAFLEGEGPKGQALKGLDGEVCFRASEEGRFTLRRHAWSGLVELTYNEVSVQIDLYSAQTDILTFRPVDLGTLAEAITTLDKGERGPQEHHVQRVPHDERQALYERLASSFDPQQPVAIYVPRWHGVALSTQTLFKQSLPLPAGAVEHPDEIGEADVEAYASILMSLGLRHIVISGGDTFNLRIMNIIHERDSSVRFDVLWHSNYLQMGEHHDWNLLRFWLAALHDGRISKIAVVKEGLEDWFKHFGVDSVFIPNIVPIKSRSLKATGVTDQVGIWLSGSSSYRKSPMAALSAVSMLPGVRVCGSGLDAAARDLIAQAGIPFGRVWDKPLPRAMLHKQMSATGLTLYVTLSECSPMLPLESFALGVPCLVGPSSHLFRDDAALKDALVVDRPLSPEAIAEKASDALRNQASLITQYKQYYKTMYSQAKAGVAALVE